MLAKRWSWCLKEAKAQQNAQLSAPVFARKPKIDDDEATLTRPRARREPRRGRTRLAPGVVCGHVRTQLNWRFVTERISQCN
ncbi:hypothetical protein EVAR_531_1 [Eumeta japonica]|uniref:Uncharacterized protein n=1 Tax=Eumeta variegata TaxID=151549 RepID=A0A4C1SDT5_EUMVA|nr:hypothetical protein EVAR_531_1 [Eumeta japonica]